MTKAILASFLAMSVGHAQTACLNANEHRPCTENEQKQMQEKICRDEPAPANLFVAHSVRLAGEFFDPSGAPIDFDSIKPYHQTIVQIRNPKSGEIIFDVPLRSNGQFEFELVPEGTYRLILIWMKNGKPGRLPLADQPRELRCSELKECRISSKITFHSSDNPTDFCPPK